MTMAPPTPVPRVTTRTLRLPAPAPNRASAQPAALASFSTTTGRPTRSATTSPMRTPVQSRLVPEAMVLRSEETKPAAPMPTATASGWDSFSSRAQSTMVSRMLARSLAGEAFWMRSRTAPSSSTTPAAIFVPPTSTPMLSAMSTPH